MITVASRNLPDGFTVIGRKLCVNNATLNVCFTDRAAKKILGMRFGRILGCGGNGCVWSLPNGRVVKITYDREDAAASLLSKGLKHVRKYSLIKRAAVMSPSAFSKKLAWRSKQEEVYVMVGEELNMRIPRYIADLDFFEDDNPIVDDLVENTSERSPKLKPSTKLRIRSGCVAPWVTDRVRCRKFADEFISTWEALARRGVYHVDVATENFGMDRRNRVVWKISDMGVSEPGKVSLPNFAHILD